MIKKLHRRLTFFFTLATGTILIIILLVTYLFQMNLTKTRNDAAFENQLLDLTNKLQSDSTFSDNLLARIESAGSMVIQIRENGNALFFPGSYQPLTDRTLLLDRAERYAAAQRVDTTKRPVSTTLSTTETFNLKGDNGDIYRAVVLVCTYQNTFRSMTLIQDISPFLKSRILQGIFFLILALLGIGSLYLISRYVIRHALLPVEEAHRKQAEFVASASHELRSPLAVIQASASAITSMPEQAEKMSYAIQKECSRAGRLVKDLLLLASADSEHMEIPKLPTDADLLMLRLYENYEPLCTAKKIHLKLQMPDDFLPRIVTNETYLYQILAILLDNAIAYGIPKEGRLEITLSAARFEKNVLLSVTDHGPGIPDSEKQHIFDRFYRSDKSRSKKDHFGLGLSIAVTLAARMHHQLNVSDTTGGGTTFTVSAHSTNYKTIR